MRILVNLLSTTNYSGRHVMVGHLKKLVPWSKGTHEYMILYHKVNRDIVSIYGENIKWVECPELTASWMGRTLWERIFLPKLVSEMNIDIVFNPAGIVYSGLGIPQVSFAQNPWCLVPEAHIGINNQIKAFLQRIAYRNAVRKATVMVFNSEFMKKAYRSNASLEEKESYVIYQGVDELTFSEAERIRQTVDRKQFHVICVSAMAPHKGIETVVESIHIVREYHGIPATLDLVGAWPDSKYEKFIKNKTVRLGLQDIIKFKGHVSRQELHRSYAEAKVFCLMSWCESFGIPAVEAQAFGTPVISSNYCAMPEISGEGGLFPPPGDAKKVACILSELLSDEHLWGELSEKALENVERFHWNRCSLPFLSLFDSISNR